VGAASRFGDFRLRPSAAFGINSNSHFGAIAQPLALPFARELPKVIPWSRPQVFTLFISHAWDYHAEYERLHNLLASDPGFKWRNLSIAKNAPVEPNPRLTKSYVRLIEELGERIVNSDCALILSGMYAADSQWIQSEIELAQKYGKPVIGIRPWGQQRVPLEVRNAAVEMVGWNRASIISAVRRYGGGDYLPPVPPLLW
jgi:hypothetical protein